MLTSNQQIFRSLLRWVVGVLPASPLFDAIMALPGGGVNPSALATNRPFLLHVCEQKDSGQQHHCSIADREADPASPEQLRPDAIPSGICSLKLGPDEFCL